MKKYLAIVMAFLILPFVVANTWIGVDVTTTDDIYADISLNGGSDSSIFVNGDQLATQRDIPSLGKAENSILSKLIGGINAVDEVNWEGFPLLFTKTGLNDFSRAVGIALYNHYVPRREFYPIAKTVEYNSLRLTAIERLLEKEYPDDYCDIKKELMEEYGLDYITCVNGVGEYIKYENPKPIEEFDEHGCKISDGYLWCENTRECYIPGEDYCDGMIVVNNEHGCIMDADCEDGFICEEEVCVEEIKGGGGRKVDASMGDHIEFLPLLKEVGEPCEENEDCLSGVCFVNTKVCGQNQY